MGRCGLLGVLAGVLVGIVAWCIIHFLSGVSPFEVPDATVLGASVSFVTPIALVGLFAGLFVGMVLPRRGKTPPSLVPEKHGCLHFVAFSALVMLALPCSCVATVTVTRNLPVALQDYWLRPLNEFLKDAERRQIKVEQIKVYDCTEWTLFADPTYFWQIKDSAGALALMTERWGLSPIDKRDERVEVLWEQMPAALCRSRDPNRIEYFANSRPYSDDSYVVLRDKARGLLVVRYRFDF